MRIFVVEFSDLVAEIVEERRLDRHPLRDKRDKIVFFHDFFLQKNDGIISYNLMKVNGKCDFYAIYPPPKKKRTPPCGERPEVLYPEFDTCPLKKNARPPCGNWPLREIAP